MLALLLIFHPKIQGGINKACFYLHIFIFNIYLASREGSSNHFQKENEREIREGEEGGEERE